jgi:nucleoside 2-deoxyribosyltransferase
MAQQTGYYLLQKNSEELMNVYRYEEPFQHIVKNAPKPVIFLAGPTVRGNQTHLTSWRFKAIEEFEKQKFIGSLIIPEFTDKTESDKGKDWIVSWEYAGLCLADCIMFWIPRTKELIGLMTNFEFGYWLARDPEKIIYGRPDDAYNVRYNDLMWKIHLSETHPDEENTYTTLEETIKASIKKSQRSYYI